MSYLNSFGGHSIDEHLSSAHTSFFFPFFFVIVVTVVATCNLILLNGIDQIEICYLMFCCRFHFFSRSFSFSSLPMITKPERTTCICTVGYKGHYHHHHHTCANCNWTLTHTFDSIWMHTAKTHIQTHFMWNMEIHRHFSNRSPGSFYVYVGRKK